MSAPPAEAPLSAAEFAARLDRLGPFEARPDIAVAVSGGPDSLALALLAARWCEARNGRVLALTVDHGLRPESGHEASVVATRMRAVGIDHATLVWTGPHPATGVQDAARTARYGLLTQACAERGILHLLLAHHADDQAETVLMRLAKGSGPDGLAGMAPVRETGAVRLLRPLLDVAKARLRSTCVAAGAAWLEDPSNLSLRFARTRWRAMAGVLAAEGLGGAAICETARRCAADRQALELELARLTAAAVTVHPEGWAEVSDIALDAPRALALRLWGRLLAAIGGAPRPPRRERLERLVDALRDDGGRGSRGVTLGGCRLSSTPHGWRAVREERAIGPALRLEPGGSIVWDGRFLVRSRLGWTEGRAGRGGGGWEVAALGAAGWDSVRAGLAPGDRAAVAAGRLPASVRRSLPALYREGRPVGVPHLGWWAAGTGPVPGPEPRMEPFQIVLRSPEPAAPPAFAVV